jgi:V8-like Glu-specific endopeptidase
MSRRSLMRHPLRSLAIAALGGALLVTPTLTTSVQADPGARPVVHVQAGSDSARHQVLKYWTRARMESAIPFDRFMALREKARAKARQQVRRAVKRGASQIIRPTSTPNGGAAWTGGGKVTHTAGRVFFTYQGRTAACSGDAVTSGNKSTVITAGHCVKLDGAWHTNWVFVPGYNNGDRPYGTWTAAKTLATPQWAASEDLNYDVGAAVVNPLDGQRLTDVVGGQGLAFNQARGQNMYSFGYPAADPYDGERLIYCSGEVIDDVLGSNDQGLSCDMTGGSSGGPWFLSFSESSGEGIQNSVNSFKYNLPVLSGYMFGPYFGTDAQNLYNQAAES